MSGGITTSCILQATFLRSSSTGNIPRYAPPLCSKHGWFVLYPDLVFPVTNSLKQLFTEDQWLKPSASSSDLWCWGEFVGAWWVHSRREANRNVVATPSGWRRSWCCVSNMHSATGQAQSTHAGNAQHIADELGSTLREGHTHSRQREDYVLTVCVCPVLFVLPRFTPLRATTCISLEAFSRWSERAVWGHCGEATASMSSKLARSLLLSSWPTNR